jgi:hypothetical protein
MQYVAAAAAVVSAVGSIRQGKQQATTSQCNEKMRGWRNTNASAMTATGMMTTAIVTAATTKTMTTMLSVAASIKC